MDILGKQMVLLGRLEMFNAEPRGGIGVAKVVRELQGGTYHALK